MLGLGLGAYIPVAIYLCVVGTCLVSLSWRPEIGIYVAVGLLPLETTREHLQAYPLGEHVIYLLLISVLAGCLFRYGSLHVRTPLNKIILIFAIVTYVSLWRGAFYLSANAPLWINDPRFSAWKDLMAMPLFFLASAYAIRSKRQMQIVVIIILVSFFAVNQLFIRNTLAHNLSHFDESKRDPGALGYAGSNGLAAYAAQLTCFILGLAAFERKILRRLLLYALATVGAVALMYTFSRGGYIGLLAGLLALGVLKKRIYLVVVVALLLTWGIILPTSVQERIKMTYSKDYGLETSAHSRVELWQDASQLILKNPIFGTGFATYRFMGRVGDLRDTHNFYVKMLVETGAVGLVIVLILMAKMAWLSHSLYRLEDPFCKGVGLGLLSLCAVMVVVNLFGDRWTYIEINGVLWVMLGMAARALLLVPAPEKPGSGSQRIPLVAAPTGGRTSSALCRPSAGSLRTPRA
jgi:O-antigen ligase